MFEKYDAYKDSDVEWLGEIPNHWSIVKLKRVVKEHSGNGFPIELQGSEDGSIPFLKVSDISGEFKSIIKSSNYVTDKIRRRNKWNLVPKNSIVTGKIGEALRKNHRKILLEDSIIDNNCIGIEAVKINYNFSYYLHKVIDFEWFVNPGTVPSISVSKYKSFKVCLPSENEQEIIVNFLDQKTSQIDQAIAIKEQQIVLLNERKQIVIQKAVTQGLDPNVPMKDSGVEWIGQIPEHWEIIRSKFLFTQRKENSKKDDVQLSATQAYGVIPQEEYEKRTGKSVVKISLHLDKRKRVHLNDFVISMRSFQGGLERAWAEGCIRSSYVVLKPLKPIDPDYYGYLFKTPMYIKALQNTSNFIRDGQDLNFGNFSQVDLFIVPLSEQKQIVEYIKSQLGDFEKHLELLNQQIEKLKEYKITLINDAVTGKIKVA